LKNFQFYDKLAEVLNIKQNTYFSRHLLLKIRQMKAGPCSWQWLMVLGPVPTKIGIPNQMRKVEELCFSEHN
jgi:hypothetical protein